MFVDGHQQTAAGGLQQPCWHDPGPRRCARPPVGQPRPARPMAHPAHTRRHVQHLVMLAQEPSPAPRRQVLAGAMASSPNRSKTFQPAPCSAAPWSRSSRAEVVARVAQRRSVIVAGGVLPALKREPRPPLHHDYPPNQRQARGLWERRMVRS